MSDVHARKSARRSAPHQVHDLDAQVHNLDAHALQRTCSAESLIVLEQRMIPE